MTDQSQEEATCAVLERIEALLNAEAAMAGQPGKYDGYATELAVGSATLLVLDDLIAAARADAEARIEALRLVVLEYVADHSGKDVLCDCDGCTMAERALVEEGCWQIPTNTDPENEAIRYITRETQRAARIALNEYRARAALADPPKEVGPMDPAQAEMGIGRAP